MKKMNKRRGLLWLTTALLLLLPFQNCAQNFQTIDGQTVMGSNSQSGGSDNPPGTGGTDMPPMPGVTTTTSTTTTLVTGTTLIRPCLASETQKPDVTALSGNTLTVLSSKGANTGRVDSGTVSFQYTNSNAPAHCQQSVVVQCNRINEESNVTAMNTAGVRMAVANNDIACNRAPQNGNPGTTINISYRANDNDTDKQCYEGVAKYRVSVRSQAADQKTSNEQIITVTFKNNCYPEQVTAETLDSYDQMGAAVAIDGSTAAVVAPGDDGDQNTTTAIGAIYIYKKNGAGVWNRSQILRTDDTAIVSDRGAANDNPASVALKGDTLVVGSEFNGSNTGAAYIFKASNGNFALARKLAGPVAGSRFGRGVAVDGSRIVVGAPAETSSKGAVYIFDSATYAQQIRIASPLAANSYFGAAVGIEGDVLAVGAPGSTLYRDTMTGEVLLYSRNASAWDEVAANPFRAVANKANIPVKDQTGGATTVSMSMGAELGASISVFSGKVLVGAPGQAIGARKAGMAFLISTPTGTPEIQTLTDISGGEGRFGTSVALGTSGALVGSPELRNRAGAVDHFAPSNGACRFVRRLSSMTGTDNDQWGFGVGFSGTDIVVGAKLNAEPNNTSGSASFISTVIP
jgi:hypothetical protein